MYSETVNVRDMKSKIRSKIMKHLPQSNKVIVSQEVPSIINKLLPVRLQYEPISI